MLWVSFHGNSEKSLGREARKRKQRRMDFKWFKRFWKRRLWFISEVRCHFLQPGTILAACWHSQGSGFQPGAAVQGVCLTWLDQGHLCSKQGWRRAASSTQSHSYTPSAAPPAGACPPQGLQAVTALFCHSSDLCYPICISFCTSGIAVWAHLHHTKVSAENVTSKAGNAPPLSQESDCRVWIWLRAEMRNPVHHLWHFFSSSISLLSLITAAC